MITASRINLFAWAIFPRGKLCCMRMVWWLNFMLKEWQIKLKNTIVVNRVLYHNKFFNKRIWIITSFQTRCQLSKFTILDTPFKTNLSSLVHTRGLTDSALPKIVRITFVTLGTKTDLKTFGGGGGGGGRSMHLCIAITAIFRGLQLCSHAHWIFCSNTSNIFWLVLHIVFHYQHCAGVCDYG